VSASLVGRSSHVKLSVRSIARSILRCRNLRQKIKFLYEDKLVCKTTLRTRRSFSYLPHKNMGDKVFNQISWKRHFYTSPLKSTTVLFNVKFSVISVDQTFCHFYQTRPWTLHFWAIDNALFRLLIYGQFLLKFTVYYHMYFFTLKYFCIML
jgi:hypothetical protein